MSDIKQTMINLIKKQPDDSSYEEILQELSLVNMINRGIQDSKENRVSDSAELEKKIKSW